MVVGVLITLLYPILCEKEEGRLCQLAPPVGITEIGSQPNLTIHDEPALIRKSPKAFGYPDRSQDFDGVDLEHFVYAQYRLADKLLTQDQLTQVLNHLQIEPQGDREI